MRLLYVELSAVADVNPNNKDRVICSFNFGVIAGGGGTLPNGEEVVQFTYEVDVTESAPIDYLNAAINAASMYMQERV